MQASVTYQTFCSINCTAAFMILENVCLYWERKALNSSKLVRFDSVGSTDVLLSESIKTVKCRPININHLFDIVLSIRRYMKTNHFK